MKMFLLGMLAMYLGTSIVTLFVGSFTKMCEDTFLENVFMFPFLVIAWITKPIKNFIKFPRVCIFCLMHGINPWNFKCSQTVELSEENQQKLIKAYPKKYQEKVKKILDDLKKSYCNNVALCSKSTDLKKYVKKNCRNRIK